MSEPLIYTVRVKSPPGAPIGPVGEWRVPATASEVLALRGGAPEERERAEAAVVARLFAAFKHALLYGEGGPDSTPIGVLGAP